MADKRINDLPVGGQVQDNDLFVIQRNGTAYSVKGEDVGGGGGGATWGSITGTLSNQTDLNTALTNKASQTDLTATQNSLQALWLLNEGQTYDIHDVTQSAYENIVGAGCKWDTVKSIGGKSLVVNQLANPIASATIKGVSVTSSNGLFTVAGTAIDGGGRGVHWTELVPLVNGHKFALLVSLTQFTNFFIQNTGGEYVSASPNSIFTLDKSSGSYGISANFVNATVYNDSGYIMLIDLTQAGLSDLTTVAQVRAILPNAYYPYSAGEIKSAVVDRVDVRGFNIWDEQTEIGAFDTTTGANQTSTVALRTKNLISVIAGQTYCFTHNTSSSSSTVWGMILDENQTPISPSLWFSTGTTYNNVGRIAYLGHGTTFTIPSNGKYLKFYTVGYGTTYNNDFCFNLSDASLNGTYKPYIAPTQTNIPASIQALDGYGRSAGSVYNYVDYDTKTYHKRVGSVDLGSLTWIKEDIGTLIRFKTTGLSFSGSRDFICRLYYTGAHTASSLENLEMYGSSNSFYVRNDTYSQYSGENFKNIMSGVILYYALPTEVVTDISSLIPADFLEDFTVEAGGSVTLHNTNGDGYRLPTPNTQSYIRKLDEVGA